MRRWLPTQLLQLAACGRTVGSVGCSGAWVSPHAAALGLACRSFASQGHQGLQRPSGDVAQAPAEPHAGARRVDGGGKQAGATMPAAELLQRFRESFRSTPTVNFIQGMPAPTAMSWLRRRGPEVPHAVLYRLFRQRQVRLFNGEKVIRVSASRPLRNGELLLYPATLQSIKQQSAGGAVTKVATARAAAGMGLENRDDVWGVGDRDGGDGGDARRQSHGSAGPGPGSDAAAGDGGGDGAEAGRRRHALFERSCDGSDGVAGVGEESRASAAPFASAGGSGRQQQRQQHQQQQPAAGQQHQPDATAPRLLTPERVRRWVLGVHPGLVFINKPAGVRVHGRSAGDAGDGGGRDGRGGGGTGGTLDSVMRQGLRFGEHDEPKLVHRLDQQASGVMVVARDADAANWLSAAFRGKSQQALAEEGDGGGRNRSRGRSSGRRGRDAGGDDEEHRGLDGVSPDLYVSRTYWAFLAGDLQPRQSGRIRYPVVVDGAYYPAVTSYRVRATGCGVSWVELTPETGRRHQLRVHCARKLGAPIIGDERYGYRGLPPRLGLRDRMPPEWWALLGEDPRVVARRLAGGGGGDGGRGETKMTAAGGGKAAAGVAAAGAAPIPVLLHARELVIKRPGKAPLVAVAPLPRYIRELFEAAGWPQPAGG